MALPETRYARTPDGVDVAYQVWGAGPHDLVLIGSAAVPIDMMWDDPGARSLLEQLGTFGRTICFDRRGWGSSDALTIKAAPSLDGWLDDITAVMTAVGSERAVLIGMSEGGTSAILYAATYPERVSGLILFNSFARFVRGPDYPCGLPPELADRYIEALQDNWAGVALIEVTAPSMVGNERWCRWFLRAARLGGSPATSAKFFRAILDTKVHHALASIQSPALVVHSIGNRHARVEHGRYLADHIPGAIYRELPGNDHEFFAGQTDEVVGEIEEFLTGARAASVIDRVLATVLFTDIVNSSQKATDVGDHAWGRLLDTHDAVVRMVLERFRGVEIKTTGDGFLVTFDGPGRAARCAISLVSQLKELGLDVRAGLHTGEIDVRSGDIGGVAVNTTARIVALAGPGEVLVSSTLKDLVAGSGLRFEDRGERELKGVPGLSRLFAVRA
jgi:class 3 adenylate cyclase